MDTNPSGTNPLEQDNLDHKSARRRWLAGVESTRFAALFVTSLALLAVLVWWLDVFR